MATAMEMVAMAMDTAMAMATAMATAMAMETVMATGHGEDSGEPFRRTWNDCYFKPEWIWSHSLKNLWVLDAKVV